MWCRFTTLTTTLMLHQSTHNTAPHINLVFSIAYFIAHGCKKSANYLYVLAPCFWAKYPIIYFLKKALRYNYRGLGYGYHDLGYGYPTLWYNYHELRYAYPNAWYGYHDLGYDYRRLRYHYLSLWYLYQRPW